MKPIDLFKSGQLHEAFHAQLSVVKNAPTLLHERLFLSELMAFRGEWDRADKQLDTVITQSNDPPLVPLLFRQLIRAEIIREQVLQDGRAPELIVALTEDATIQLELCTALRLGQSEDAVSLLEKAESLRQPLHGNCNDKECELFQDMDDRFRGIVEVLTATGKYFWVPTSAIRTLEFAPPERPMDLLWRKASIQVEKGPDGEVFIPTRYPLGKDWDAQLLLSRATDWQEAAPGLVVGRGQRTFLVGDDGLPIMDIRSLSIQQPAA